MARQHRPSLLPRFRVGDAVRVKRGIRDPDFPDVPLGGWVGTIKEVEAGREESCYLIAWSRETLAAIHPVFRKRCERDGLEYEETWLAEEDIELNEGQPLCIEQPTAIETPSLSPRNQDDRIRAILGFTGDDPLPDVNEKTLAAYWHYLGEHLSFPFAARHAPEDGPRSEITVVALADPDEYECDEFYGLFCEAQLGRRHIVVSLGEIEVKKGAANHQLIHDYLYWFWNWR